MVLLAALVATTGLTDGHHLAGLARPAGVLRVGAGTQLHLGIVAVVVARFDQRASSEKSAVALILDLNELRAVARFDFAQSALQHRTPAIDQTD